MNERPTHRNTFEFGLTLLNTEVFGIRISSESKVQNWAVSGLLFTLLLALIVAAVAPVIVPLLEDAP